MLPVNVLVEGPTDEPVAKKLLEHVNNARTSRSKSIRDDLVPRQGSGAKVGPLYLARLTDFTAHQWQPVEGEKHSQSLQRCIRALFTLNTLHSN